jgi:transposase-like protein
MKSTVKRHRYNKTDVNVKTQIINKITLDEITIKEATEQYGISQSTISSWIQQNKKSKLTPCDFVIESQTDLLLTLNDIETQTDAVLTTSNGTQTDVVLSTLNETQTDRNDDLQAKIIYLSSLVDVNLDYRIGFKATMDFIMLQKHMKYQTVDINGDGHCLFRCLGYKSIEQNKRAVTKFRTDIYNHLNKNEDKFETLFRSLDIHIEGEGYIDNIKNNINSNEYADNVDYILYIVADYLQCNIYSYMFNRTDKSIILPSKAEDPNYHDSIAILHNGLLPDDPRAHYYYLKPM